MPAQMLSLPPWAVVDTGGPPTNINTINMWIQDNFNAIKSDGGSMSAIVHDVLIDISYSSVMRH